MKPRAPRNRTLVVDASEQDALLADALTLTAPADIDTIRNRVLGQSLESCLAFLPRNCIDLLIIDPPYNLSKTYGDNRFSRQADDDYRHWFAGWFESLLPCLKQDASVYVCCDWQSSPLIHAVLDEHLVIRNRITWEREKGRGASANWKNCAEDIWFCTCGDQFHFDVEAVKLRRRVLAPYRQDGKPRDWQENSEGRFRLTHPSNLWTDISVPFWSMPENTDHPTQKPEKLIAKLILASSKPGDFVFDPFLGSGTTAVVARKLGRDFAGVEKEAQYCAMALKRLALAAANPAIQGYQDGYFWERNSLAEQKAARSGDGNKNGQ